VDAALTSFWLDRAERAPSAGEMAAHLEGERAYLDAITPK
jgi:hypothetical protein